MTCIALAWTSPEIVVIDLDRDRYRAAIIRDAKSRRDLELFTEAEDPRDVVALVDGVSVLARVADVPGVKAFIVFDTVSSLRGITGAHLLDQEPGRDDCAIRRIHMDDIHRMIAQDSTPFSVPKGVLTVSAELASKITLRELFTKIQRKGGAVVTDEFLARTCDRLVGRISKTTWVGKVRKPALAAGLDTQILAELERFVEDSSTSEGLWRGFFDLVERNEPMEEVEKRYDVRRDDLEYLVSVLGSEPAGEDAYASSPKKTKKRKA
jgi:hypothetical protein